jgi:hypothetical protein
VLADRLAYRSRGKDGETKLIYFASGVLLPAMSELFIDQDKVSTTLTLLLHQLILVALKKGSK